MDLMISDLSCNRGGRRLISGLSATLGAGSATALRGPNGVGKSTLLRSLAGFLPLDGGDARLGTVSRAEDPGGFQEQVAYAGHLDAIKPALGVARNLALWAGIFGAAPARVEAALEHFSLTALADQPAGQCSAGQKRRLGLARLALVDRPLWLLDEPTVSLDAENTALVADLVRNHCAGGGVALIATHIDLGIEGMDALTLSPPTGTTGGGAPEASDAFLDGDWT